MKNKNNRESEEHNCDLFLLSSHKPYYAKESLMEFAILGHRNADGWGIGSYDNGNTNIIRSSDPALGASYENKEISREFKVAMNATRSAIMLGHLRFTSSGESRVENNHPFKLHFLGYDWLLIHNGTARDKEKLVLGEERLLLESNSDTPRVFEFLRRQIIDYYTAKPGHSLIESCRKAYASLLAADAGNFNIILSNGFLSFAFIHWRPFYLLNREKQSGDVALLSTLRLSEKEEWLTFERGREKKARMLVFNGSTLIFNGDVPR